MEKSLYSLYTQIEGWLLPEEAQMLYHLALNDGIRVGKGVIVEIGSWKGKSTVILGYACKQIGTLCYAIDPHTGSPEHGDVWTFNEFKRNIKMANLEEVVIPIVKNSEAAHQGWTLPIRFLWIDGNHTYHFVKSDFLLWQPFVVEGGIVAFHDSVLAQGVYKVVRELFFSSWYYKNFRFVGNIVCAEKTSKISMRERMKNYFSMWVWLLYGFYSKKGWRLPTWIKSILKLVPRPKMLFKD